MSTSATASESHEFELGVDPEKTFDEIAFHESTVCSRCFCLIRAYDDYRPDVGVCGGVSKYAPTERLRRAFDGGKGYKATSVETKPGWIDRAPIPPEDFVYGYRPINEPRTFCEECGSQSGRAGDESLSIRQAVAFADNLVDRLHEAGVSVDGGELKHAVKKFKAYEDLEAFDTEIFRRATKIVIKRARRRRL